MRNSIILFLLVCSVFFATAQKPLAPAFIYTQGSAKYLGSTEIDSILQAVTADLFKENRIPSELFEKKYPVIKNHLLRLTKNDIVKSFKAIESSLKKNGLVSNNEPTQFSDTKKLYSDELEKKIRAAFLSETLLSQYLTFNNSDRISFFNSTVTVRQDGTLLVQEKITVYNGNGNPHPVYGNDPALQESGAVNNEIKRGIVRAFPLYYINEYKLFQNTTFVVKEVLRDGKREEYHTEKQENGILLYTGNRNVFLNPGYYTYTITYETDHQLKGLKDFDELYWNVTGNGWSFRIDSARCNIVLPEGTKILSGKCYTGAQGSKAEDCNFFNRVYGGNELLLFNTTKPLSPKEGLTVSVSWPKGIVNTPGFLQQAKYFIWNNKAVFFLPIAALLSAVICFVFWFRYGRDPKKGTIYPQFEPPAGFSPAALGYIYYHRFDRQLTAAAIVDAAVRNKIKIDVKREGLIFKHNEYTISSSSLPAKPATSSYEDFESDIEDLAGTTIEKGKYNSELGSLNTTIQDYCEKNYKNKDGTARNSYRGFFALNNSYTTLPLLICIAAAGWAFFDGIVQSLNLRNFWQLAYFAAGIFVCVIVLKVFSKLLAAYSPEGRKLADKIEGFRMFLVTADEKRFDSMNPPAKSLELYEKYLPFAMALGCEIEWGQQFEEIINTAYMSGKAATSFSQSFTRDSESFSSSFTSSFSGAIASAGTPPSSSSGGGSSFGGGSSGGGGGGGGGGGW